MIKYSGKGLGLFVMILTAGVLSISPGFSRIQSPSVFFDYVENETGVVADAVVRIQATEYYMRTDTLGYFELAAPISPQSVTLTAWSDGHCVGFVDAAPSSQPLTIHKSKYYTLNNPDRENLWK